MLPLRSELAGRMRRHRARTQPLDGGASARSKHRSGLRHPRRPIQLRTHSARLTPPGTSGPSSGRSARPRRMVGAAAGSTTPAVLPKPWHLPAARCPVMAQCAEAELSVRVAATARPPTRRPGAHPQQRQIVCQRRPDRPRPATGSSSPAHRQLAPVPVRPRLGSQPQQLRDVIAAPAHESAGSETFHKSLKQVSLTVSRAKPQITNTNKG
jgi:hypothetical protein